MTFCKRADYKYLVWPPLLQRRNRKEWTLSLHWNIWRQSLSRVGMRQRPWNTQSQIKKHNSTCLVSTAPLVLQSTADNQWQTTKPKPNEWDSIKLEASTKLKPQNKENGSISPVVGGSRRKRRRGTRCSLLRQTTTGLQPEKVSPVSLGTHQVTRLVSSGFNYLSVVSPAGEWAFLSYTSPSFPPPPMA